MQRNFELLTKDNVKLASNFYANPDKGNAEYFNAYIRYNALGDMIEGRTVTHILVERDKDTKTESILGYVTLRNSSFVKDYDGKKIGYPSLEICNLCVDKKYEGTHIGTYLVAFSMKMAKLIAANIAGVQYLVLCATSDSKDFYMRDEFGFAPTDELLPRNFGNETCIPMYLKLKFQ